MYINRLLKMANINYGYVGMALMLITSGVYIIESDKIYICDTGETWKFDRLSDDNIIGYYTVDGVQNTKECSSGWKVFTNTPTTSTNNCLQMECSIDGCICKE
ncbi:MAG TPA: hypothetical protein V6C58_06525 [Allocoleopsis sp.]